MRQTEVTIRWWMAGIGFFYLVGLIAHAIPALRQPYMLLLTPGFLSVSGGLVVWLHLCSVPALPFWRWFVPVSVATLLIEIAGVSTGLVFGPYSYTAVLGPAVAGVPFLIGLNWVLVVAGACAFVSILFPRWPSWIRTILTGLFCVCFDLLLEPVAVHLGYWVWHTPDIPIQNYLAWGLIGTLAALGAPFASKTPPRSPLAWYVCIQTTFFAGIDLWILVGWIS